MGQIGAIRLNLAVTSSILFLNVNIVFTSVTSKAACLPDI
jgi:hypothetical protein